MTKMRAMIVPKPGGPLRLEERDVPQPGRHEVLIRVHACGVCHSDSLTVEGHMPGIAYPRIPGHEVIGTVEALGPEADRSIEEVRRLLQEQGLVFSFGSRQRFFKRHAITRKKRLPTRRSRTAPTL